MAELCGRRRLATLALVAGVHARDGKFEPNLRGFLEQGQTSQKDVPVSNAYSAVMHNGFLQMEVKATPDRASTDIKAIDHDTYGTIEFYHGDHEDPIECPIMTEDEFKQLKADTHKADADAYFTGGSATSAADMASHFNGAALMSYVTVSGPLSAPGTVKVDANTPTDCSALSSGDMPDIVDAMNTQSADAKTQLRWEFQFTDTEKDVRATAIVLDATEEPPVFDTFVTKSKGNVYFALQNAYPGFAPSLLAETYTPGKPPGPAAPVDHTNQASWLLAAYDNGVKVDNSKLSKSWSVAIADVTLALVFKDDAVDLGYGYDDQPGTAAATWELIKTAWTKYTGSANLQFIAPGDAWATGPLCTVIDADTSYGKKCASDVTAVPVKKAPAGGD